MSRLAAQYASTCAVCGGRVSPGQTTEYTKGQPVRHAGCVPEPLPSEATITVVSDKGGAGWEKGAVIHHADKHGRPVEPRYLVICRVTHERVWDDDEERYQKYVAANCRPATEEESAALRAEDAARDRQHEARRTLERLAETITREGERPVRASSDHGGLLPTPGRRLADTQTIYGGGSYFVLGDDSIWYVRVRGGDGDDWSANNVRTGGAGGIGYRVPRTEALAEELVAAAETAYPSPVPGSSVLA